MASKNGKNGEEKTNTLLWVGVTALVTAGVVYYFNKYAKEREELQAMKLQKQLAEKSG